MRAAIDSAGGPVAIGTGVIGLTTALVWNIYMNEVKLNEPLFMTG